jgi:hypothetical protein
MKKLVILLLFAPFLSCSQAIAQQAPVSADQPKEIKVALEAMRKYAGVYELNQEFKITISVEQGKLYALAPGDQEKSEFTPETETKYYLRGTPARIEFTEENGQRYLLVNLKGGLKLMKTS